MAIPLSYRDGELEAHYGLYKGIELGSLVSQSINAMGVVLAGMAPRWDRWSRGYADAVLTFVDAQLEREQQARKAEAYYPGLNWVDISGD